MHPNLCRAELQAQSVLPPIGLQACWHPWLKWIYLPCRREADKSTRCPGLWRDQDCANTVWYCRCPNVRGHRGSKRFYRPVGKPCRMVDDSPGPFQTDSLPRWGGSKCADENGVKPAHNAAVMVPAYCEEMFSYDPSEASEVIWRFTASCSISSLKSLISLRYQIRMLKGRLICWLRKLSLLWPG
jgi:hypothetical protein